jgi:hypothetical protein
MPDVKYDGKNPDAALRRAWNTDSKPRALSHWIRVGARVTIPKGGMVGTVLRVRKDVGMPYYVVRWDNGNTGRHGLASGLIEVE